MIKLTLPKIDKQYKGIRNIAISKNCGKYCIFSRPNKKEFSYRLGLEVLNPGVRNVYVYQGISSSGIIKIDEAVCRLNDGKRVNLERLLGG